MNFTRDEAGVLLLTYGCGDVTTTVRIWPHDEERLRAFLEVATNNEQAARIAELEVENANLRANGRRMLPGLWIVEDQNHGQSRSHVANLANLPDPLRLGKLATYEGVILAALREACATRYSLAETANAVVLALDAECQRRTKDN